MKKTNLDPSSYIASLAPDDRETISYIDGLISEVMDGQTRTLWEGKFWGGTDQKIIGYGDLNTTQSRGKKVEWFMVGLAVQKNYFSLYINAVEEGQYVSEKYAPELGKVKVGKASISFKKVEDLDIPSLRKVLVIARNHLR